MKKVFFGNAPESGVAVEEFDGFVLFNLTHCKNKKYLGFKLVSIEPREAKANYWISYKREGKVLVSSHDEKTMREHNPELVEKVMAAIMAFEEEIGE